MKYSKALSIRNLMIGTVIFMSGLMTNPSSLHGQSEMYTSITHTGTESLSVHHVHSQRIDFQAYRFDTSGLHQARFRLSTPEHLISSQSIEQTDTKDENNKKSGFLYRNRYLITGTAVAAGVGTYLIFKTKSSKGDPVFLPIPPGRP